MTAFYIAEVDLKTDRVARLSPSCVNKSCITLCSLLPQWMNKKVRKAMWWLRGTHAVVVREARVGRVKDVRNEKWRSGGSDKNGC